MREVLLILLLLVALGVLGLLGWGLWVVVQELRATAREARRTLDAIRGLAEELRGATVPGLRALSGALEAWAGGKGKGRVPRYVREAIRWLIWSLVAAAVRRRRKMKRG